MLKTLIFHKTPSVVFLALIWRARCVISPWPSWCCSLLARVGNKALQMRSHSSHLLDTIRTIFQSIYSLSNNLFIFLHLQSIFWIIKRFHGGNINLWNSHTTSWTRGTRIFFINKSHRRGSAGKRPERQRHRATGRVSGSFKLDKLRYVFWGLYSY